MAISAWTLGRTSFGDVYPWHDKCNDLQVWLNVLCFQAINAPHPARYGRGKSGFRYSTCIVKLLRHIRDFLHGLKMKYVVFSFHPLIFYHALGVGLIELSSIAGLHILRYRFIEHQAIFVAAFRALIFFAPVARYWLFATSFETRQERDNSG